MLPLLQETFLGPLRDGELHTSDVCSIFSPDPPLLLLGALLRRNFGDPEEERNKFLLGDHCSVESKCPQRPGRGQSLGQAPEIVPAWNASYPSVISW